MKSGVLLLLMAVLPYLVASSYHVLIADGSTNAEAESFQRVRRSLASKDEVLEVFMEEESGSGDDTSPEQEVTFVVQNNDDNPAELVLRDVIPGDAILTDFTIHNEGYSHKLFHARHREKKDALREYNEAIAAGYSTALLVDETSKNLCSDCKQGDDSENQSITSLLSIASGDTISVSISFAFVLSGMLPDEATFKYDSTVEWTYSATDVQGLIMSPNYPDSYPNNADISWLIRLSPAGGLVIRGNLMSLETESCCDYLYVYDGATSSGEELLSVSGNQNDASFVSSGPNVLVHFTSNCCANQGGFSLEYFSETVGDNVTSEEKIPVDQTYVLHENTGAISSPKYPEDYPPSSNIVWEIVTTPETRISFQIIDFELAESDSLVIIDDVTSSSLVSLTGDSEYPTAPFETNGNKVSVVFRSHPKRVTTYRGFYITYHSAFRCAFDLEIEDEDFEWKYLSYPGSGNDYSSNLDCTWTISGPSDYSIHIRINQLDLETIYDFLNIYDGDTQSPSNRIARISGVGGEYLDYFSTESSAQVQFTSDASINQNGFQIQYKLYSITTTCSSFPVSLTNDEGSIQNVNYPSYDYSSAGGCQWLIQVDETKVVMITLQRLYNSYYEVTIYDGPSTSDSALVSYDYADNDQGHPMTTSTNQALVVLDNNGYVNYNWLYLFTYVAIDKADSTMCSNPSTYSSSPGVIVSPFFPDYYPTNTQCQWVIESSSSETITLIFQYISMQSYDSLIFYDGNTTSDDVLYRCGSSSCYSSRAFSTTSNQMLISFTSAPRSDETYSSFKLVYYFEDGDSLISATDSKSGFAISPSFPNAYPTYDNEYYYLVVPEGYAIHFYFQVLDIDCCSDYLYLYDGNSTSAPLIDSLYYYDSDHYFGMTTGNMMTMWFTTSYSNYANTGFVMLYEGVRGNISDTDVAYNYIAIEDAGVYTDFYSPGFESFYRNDFDALWYFEYDGDDVRYIRFYFYRMQIDETDFVKLYLDFGTELENLQYTVIGNFYLSRPYVSIYSKRVTMWFHSSSRFSGKGFFLQYIAYN